MKSGCLHFISIYRGSGFNYLAPSDLVEESTYVKRSSASCAVILVRKNPHLIQHITAILLVEIAKESPDIKIKALDEVEMC